MPEATHKNVAGAMTIIAAAAIASGEILQLCDGRAAYYEGLQAAAAGDAVSLRTDGLVTVPKTASIAILDGGRVYWDRSASKAHYKQDTGDFYLGVAVGDAAAADTEVVVNLNVQPNYRIQLGSGRWTNGATNGLGVTQTALGGSDLTLSFDAVAEAAMAALHPTAERVAVADGPIFEARIAIFNIGDNAALDINVGLANGTHATDADSITESVFFHLDGNSLNINAESDDGTTEVAATDTTVDAVDDTYFEVWIDARNLADIQLYIDGVNVLPATVFKLDAATGPLMPIIHVEKTSDDTVADVRVESMSVRTTDLA